MKRSAGQRHLQPRRSPDVRRGRRGPIRRRHGHDAALPRRPRPAGHGRAARAAPAPGRALPGQGSTDAAHPRRDPHRAGHRRVRDELAAAAGRRDADRICPASAGCHDSTRAAIPRTCASCTCAPYAWARHTGAFRVSAPRSRPPRAGTAPPGATCAGTGRCRRRARFRGAWPGWPHQPFRPRVIGRCRSSCCDARRRALGSRAGGPARSRSGARTRSRSAGVPVRARGAGAPASAPVRRLL